MKVRIILLFLLQSSIAYSVQFKVIGYLPTWQNYPSSINNVQLTKVTHINIAFANPDASGNLVPADGTNADVTTVVNAAHAQGVKVFISIGGAGANGNRYKTLLNTTASTTKFIDTLVNYVLKYNLDGIDVDIEGDVLGPKVTAAKYESFVTALAIALHAQGKSMSAALAQWFGSDVTTTAAAQFDWINIMSYDAAIPGTGDPVGQHAPYSMVLSDYQYWNTTKSVPAANLVIGVPFYGYGWGTKANANNDEISYCSIVSSNAGAENNDQVGSGNNVIYYNGIPTIQQKTTYAIQNASGVMIWELTEDCNDATSLLSAIYTTIQSGGTTAVESGKKTDSGYEVFPNPFSNTFTLRNNNSAGDSNVEILNAQGALVETITIPAGSDNSSVGNSFKPGMYFLKIGEGDSFSYLRIIKQ